LIYPHYFEEKIGFIQIRTMLSEACLGELGRKWVESIQFLTKPDVIQEKHQQTFEFLKVLESDRPFPAEHYLNMLPLFKRIRVVGTAPEVDEMLSLKLSLDAIRSVLNYFKGEESEGYPTLRELAKEVPFFPAVLDSVNKIIGNKGQVKDGASVELRRIRRSLKEKESHVSSRMHRILKKAKADGIASEDTELAVRDGRLVLPVKSADKRKIAGLVHDESASGKTSFIEPADIVEMNNEIRELGYAERREIRRILIEFTDAIRPYLDDLSASYHFLGHIDFIRSKANLARKLVAGAPGMRDQPAVHWEQAGHPLLLLNFRESGKQVIPLDIDLNESKRILLISGPNAGGKSVCLQTVGLLQYMYQCGLPVPVGDNSFFGIFQKIFLDFGDDQSIENDLSTYSSHLLNMKYFVKHAGPNTLVLIDEFGTGTEPLLGGAIAQAILKRLDELGAYGVMTTHYTNLKHFASSAEHIENGAMLFDHQKMKPLYQLQMGKPGSSFAFEIARGIGLPEDILKNATDTIGEDHIYFDKHLREIARDKRYWENKRSRIRKTEKNLEATLSNYEEELESLRKRKKKIIDDARKEAENLLEGVNRKIEHTIRVIRETQAEKEQTKTARKVLGKLREQLGREDEKQGTGLERKIRLVKSRKARIRSEENINNQVRETNARETGEIQPGDKVKMKGQEAWGEVLEISGRNYLIAFGNMITSLNAGQFERVSQKEYRRHVRPVETQTSYAENLRDKRLNFNPKLDVRGKRADEALQLVGEFIDEAIMVERKDLVVLHGKGNGILRQMIREYLAGIDLVDSYRDEHPDRGGAGITLVKLEL